MKLKRSTYPAILKLFAAAAVLGAGPMVALAGVAELDKPGQAADFIDTTDRLIVKYRDSVASNTGAARIATLGKDRLAKVDRAGQQFGLTMKMLHATATGAHIIKLSKKVPVAEVEALARDLAERDPSVEYAEPDRLLQPMFTPNDPRYSEQWHYFEAIGGLRANLAWDKATGAGVKVAVIDTGYRPHADLAGQFVGGYDFITDTAIAADGDGRDSDASDPGDSVIAGQCGAGRAAQSSSWHGTHVAGTIAAVTNNGVGVAGVAYNAKIVPVRVLGKCGGYTSDIADAIIWSSGGIVIGVPANANPARVINMSLGGGGACGVTTQNAINSARLRGTVVIVAAGNSNTDASTANPANCAGVVTVAATNRAGGRAYYSNYGAVVDVAAPGGDSRVAANGVLSSLNAGATTPGADNYAFYQGTSMAAPHVAGVVALMLSKNGALTPDEVESRLKSSARAFPATCTACGAGIVDANAAVDAATATGTSPSPSPGPGTGAAINETESNNTVGTANAVATSNTTVSGNMGSTTDTDYFVVQLPAGKTLTSTLTMSSASNDFDLYVYNSSGALLAKSDNGAGAVDSVAVANTGATTSAHNVRVVYYSGGTGATSGQYTLKLAW